jgi:O-antigen/teichoic acid export membrane protein
MPIPSPLPEELSTQDPAAAQAGSYPLIPPDVVSEAVPIKTSQTSFDRLLVRIANVLGLDRAIVFTILARSWSSFAGLGTLTLIAHFLSPVEQGYYYTFYSLVAIQVIFELGFSVVILQTASHEAAHLSIDADGTISGPVGSHARLASVLQKSVRWYTTAAVLMATVVLPVGIHFFRMQSAAHPSGTPVAWLVPWILVIVATSCTFQIDPTFSFLEGCGFVPQIARTRFAQAILGTVMGWIALLLHHGLLAPGLMILGQAIAGSGFIYGKRRLLLPLLRYDPGEYRINWGSEVWPFQWRIAVSWLCGYATFELFNPILFHYRGPVEAGQMGMSTSICGTLSSLAIAWMNTKASPFGQMISRREYKRLDSIFFRALIQSTSVAILSCALVLFVVIILRSHHVSLAARLLPPIPLAMLFGATIFNIVVFAEALYLRAHKQEKFMICSILGALCMTPAAFILGRFYGAFGIAACYLLVCLVIGLGYGTFTFTKWRKIWHAA